MKTTVARLGRTLLTLAVVAASLAATGGGQPAVAAELVWGSITLDIEDVNDAIRDPSSGRLYVSVGSGDPTYGNRVVTVDGASGAVVDSEFVGSEPTVLALADDGSRLYVGLDGAASVREVLLPELTAARQISLGSGVFGPRYPEDIAVQPGNPLVIAVSRYRKGVSPRHDGVAVFDDGVQLTDTTADHTGSNTIEFSSGDPARLYGYTNETTGFGFWRMDVDVDGVRNVDSTPDLIQGFHVEILEAGGRIYSSSGRILDPEPRQLLGTLGLTTASPAFTVDVASQRAYYLESSSPHRVRVYDISTFVNVDNVTIDGLAEPTHRLIRWGSDGLAAVTNAGELVLASPTLTPPTPPPGPPSVSGGFGEYVPLAPARLLDTRTSAPLGPGGSRRLQVAGQQGAPASGIIAAVLNVTVTEPTAESFLTVWPNGQARPNISSLNFVPGQTVPNLVTVALGADGAVSLYNNAGQAHVVVDIAGVYLGEGGGRGSRFEPIVPDRVLDTRTGPGVLIPGPRPPGDELRIQLVKSGGLPIGATAVVMNVTVTEPTDAGFLTAYPSDRARPLASNLNYVAGQTVPNLVITRLSADGAVTFYHPNGTAHLVVDVVGYYHDNLAGERGRFVPFQPYRTFDSRTEPGVPMSPTSSFTLFGEPDISAWVLNVTVTEPTAAGFFTVHPSPGPRPNASNLNFVPGQTVPNHVIVGGAPDVAFYNSNGLTHVIVDVFGAFTI